jgi:hypothetical protein
MWWARTLRFILFSFIVAPWILAGAFFLILPFAFATMQDPDKPLSWSEYLAVVWKGGSECFVVGSAMIIFGVMIARSPLPGAPSKSA